MNNPPVRQRKPGIGSLLMRAAWSVRIKLLLSAVFLIGIGYGAGWLARSFTAPQSLPARSITKKSPAGISNPSAAVTPKLTAAAVHLGIYVANSDRITAYRINANGNVTPAIILSGPAAALSYPSGIAFDAAGNIYVSNRGGFFSSGKGTVTVYPAAANGEAIPSAAISGPATRLSAPCGIAVDRSGDIYVGNGYDSSRVSGGDASITVYPPHASGNAAPIRTILGRDYSSLTPHYSLYRPLTIGLRGPYLYALNGGNQGIITLRAVASGKAHPLDEIYGPNTGLSAPSALGIGPRGNLYVTDASANSLSVFSAGATGDIAPSAVISGPATGLANPTALAIGPTGFIYVANAGRSGVPVSVTVYPPGARNNAAPVATIAGPFTELSRPSAIAIGPIKDSSSP